MKRPIRQRWLKGLAVATGLALMLIGLRFALDPKGAAAFFGAVAPSTPAPLHQIIAGRDVWLGLMLVIMAWWSDWRGMALWLGLAVLVCFADAGIALSSSGRVLSVLFHLASGVFCAALGWACWREYGAGERSG